MNVSRSAAYALGVMAAALLFAACGGGPQSSSLAPNATTNAARSGASLLRNDALEAFVTTRQPGPAHPDRHQSWISPDAKRIPRLLFVSDSGKDDVYIYSLPHMTLEGTLTGFNDPQGLCSDTKGHVYVVNTGTNQVFSYSHSGTPGQIYTDPFGPPVGCAVDPISDQLAVADISGFSGAGQVVYLFFTSIAPVAVSNPAQYSYYFLGFGKGGELWTSGRASDGSYMVSQCNFKTCSTVNLSGGTIYFPGAVQWDNARHRWVLFDQLCGDTEAACSYPVSASSVLGKPTHYDNYEGGNDCDMVQGAIAGHDMNFVVGGDYEYCGAASSSYGRWQYTAGGNPKNYAVLSSAYSVPIGTAVSTKNVPSE
ncbi:MAG: hypothetical protein WCC84_03400 [Candidatus Cybelea sp.]